MELIGSIVVAAPANYTDIREPILCSFGDRGRNCQARKGIGRSPKQTGRPYIEQSQPRVRVYLQSLTNWCIAAHRRGGLLTHASNVTPR